MRLQQNEIAQIKKVILKEFGKSEIYIFGSQLDKSKWGGDIDIFIIPQNREELHEKESKVKFFLEEKILKPIDILIHYDFNRDIEKEAIKGIKLT